MILRVWRYGLAASVVVALALLSVAGGSGSWVQGQGCTVTVQPGESIQRAIDEAKEGAVVCLVAGTWEENLVIRKSLTLRGAGREQTKIKGKKEDKSVISIASDAEILVSIDGLTVAEAIGASGIEVAGKARVSITTSQISGNRDGIYMKDSAQAEIRGSTIEGNGTKEDCKKKEYICSGIEVWGKSQVKIIDSKILKNADWGVGAWLKQCGYWYDDFTGTVTFEEMELEEISGNSTTNNQAGMGNPGNHYWNRPDIPDGQVCLP